MHRQLMGTITDAVNEIPQAEDRNKWLSNDSGRHVQTERKSPQDFRTHTHAPERAVALVDGYGGDRLWARL